MYKEENMSSMLSIRNDYKYAKTEKRKTDNKTRCAEYFMIK